VTTTTSRLTTPSRRLPQIVYMSTLHEEDLDSAVEAILGEGLPTKKSTKKFKVKALKDDGEAVCRYFHLLLTVV
jgi:hypothetical protein